MAVLGVLAVLEVLAVWDNRAAMIKRVQVVLAVSVAQVQMAVAAAVVLVDLVLEFGDLELLSLQ